MCRAARRRHRHRKIGRAHPHLPAFCGVIQADSFLGPARGCGPTASAADRHLRHGRPHDHHDHQAPGDVHPTPSLQSWRGHDHPTTSALPFTAATSASPTTTSGPRRRHLRGPAALHRVGHQAVGPPRVGAHPLRRTAADHGGVAATGPPASLGIRLEHVKEEPVEPVPGSSVSDLDRSGDAPGHRTGVGQRPPGGREQPQPGDLALSAQGSCPVWPPG